jgi:hypothetical protein
LREGCHIMCVMKKCAKTAQTIANPPSECRAKNPCPAAVGDA